MTLPSNANIDDYPGFANARSYDFEFFRMMQQCSAQGEGIAPFDNTKDCTITGMGANKATDLEVVTGASGLNLSVTLGNAWVQGDTRSTQGLYFCHVPANVTVTASAAHATHPRIDRLVLKVEDADVSGSVTQYSLVMVPGTATAGATLSNLTGAAALPDNCLMLAYVLVPATFAGPFVNATHILDQRFFAYNPGRIIGRLSTTSDSAGSGDKLGPLTVCSNNVQPVKLRGKGSIASTGAAGTSIRLEIRDGASGGGSLLDKSEHSMAGANYLMTHNPEAQSTFNGQKSLYLNLQTSSGTPTLYVTAYGTAFLEARYI